jgi:Tol biopolymer transport system component
MDADAANEVRLTDTISVDYGSRLDWSPDGTQIAFRGYNMSACCSYKLWSINADGTGLAEVYPGSSAHQPEDPVWSPAGDSLAYDYGSAGMIYRVAASGDTTGVRASRLTGGQDYPNWMPEGILFRGYPVPQYGVFLLTPGGRHLQVTDGLNTDHDLTIRRTTRYVDSVTMSPTSATIGPAGTQEYVVTVLDDLGAAIVPGSGIRCTSSNESVATVVTNASQNCLATGVADGTATISATAGGWRSATASITVASP